MSYCLFAEPTIQIPRAYYMRIVIDSTIYRRGSLGLVFKADLKVTSHYWANNTDNQLRVHHEDKRYTGYTKGVIDTSATEVRRDTRRHFGSSNGSKNTRRHEFQRIGIDKFHNQAATKTHQNLEQGSGLSVI